MATSLFPMLSCADLPRSLEFYGDLVGGIEAYRFPDEGDPEFVSLTVGDGKVGLAVVEADGGHGRARRPVSGHRIELCVYVDDVEATYARAREAGFETVTDPTDMPWGERVAWVSDPDGNLVMLTQEASADG